MRVSLQRFPSLPPEIQNHCSPGAVLEGFLAAIPKSGPEIKNHCTLEGVSRQNHAAIPKSGPEIKNHCSRGLVGSAGGPFFFAATKNRIGRGRSLRRRTLQAGHSPTQQRRLESNTEDRSATVAAATGLFLWHVRGAACKSKTGLFEVIT